MENISDESLMENIREYKAIYDRYCKAFKDRNLKRNAWVELEKKLEVPRDTLEKRYNSIRTAFGRYLKANKPASGSGRDSITIAAEYEHLRWLITYIKQRTATSSNHPKTHPEQNKDNATQEEVEGAEDPDVSLVDTTNDEEDQSVSTQSSQTQSHSSGKGWFRTTIILMCRSMYV